MAILGTKRAISPRKPCRLGPPFPLWHRPSHRGGSEPRFWAQTPYFRVRQRVALVETPYGTARVGVLGSPRPGRPAILTFPDVGHTHESCFAPLFAHPEMQEIARGFLRLHLEAPGMEEGAPPYPSGSVPAP
uniref:Uncharacterized protein n=1 Tax=Anas platyrhynchos platyrhynchos TaxID=8840 RepID=A0A493TV97_ANAPP